MTTVKVTKTRLRPRRITPRQTLFAQAVAGGLTYAEAARQAGYTEATGVNIGSNLAKLPHVVSEIARARESLLTTKLWSIEWWRGQLADAHAQAVLAKDLPSRLRALELAGRHLGALESRADTASAELSARLTQHLVQAMALQMATATVDVPVTVEGEIRRLLPSGVSPTIETALPQKA